MGKITERLYNQIKENSKGVIQYEIGLEKASKYIDNLRKGNLILLGGNSGCGKTTFVLYHYIYRPIMYCIENNIKDLDIIVFCLELSSVNTLSKLCTMYVYEKYDKIIGFKDMMSFNGRISDENMEIMNDAMAMINKIESYIRFVEEPLNHRNLENYLVDYYSKRGTFLADGSYMPNNEKLITLSVIDHIGEVSVPQGMSKKEAMDKVADVLKNARNKCGLSSVVLQQINRGQSTVERRTKFPGIESNDFKDTGGVYEKADVAIGLYNPFNDKQKNVFDYDIIKFGERLRILQVLKGRYGEANVNIGLSFFGEVSMTKEIPRGDMIDDYSRFKSLSYLRENMLTLENINSINEI